MRRLLLMLPLLLLSTPAFGWEWFSFYGDTDRRQDCSPPPAVPEPTALLLFAAGAGLIGWRVGRRQR